MKNKARTIAFIFCIFLTHFIFAEVYKSNALVSYYADDFHGKKTSNGEVFNMYALTCASKQLPFNTILRLTNLTNGKTVEVRVNDRGPFVADRELDLSKAAAAKLGMLKSGTTHVKIEVVSWGKNTKLSYQTAVKACKIAGIKYTAPGPKKTSADKTASAGTAKTASKSTASATTSSAAKKTTTGTAKAGSDAVSKSTASKNVASGKTKAASKSESANNETEIEIPVSPSSDQSYDTFVFWDIQLGAFSKKENAVNLAQRLINDGFKDVVLQKSGNIYRVVIRKVSGQNVPIIKGWLSEKGYTDMTIRQRKGVYEEK